MIRTPSRFGGEAKPLTSVCAATLLTVTDAPPEFSTAASQLERATLRPEITLTPIPSPGSVAPFSVAFAAEVRSGKDDAGASLGTGRFILLYDPEQVDAWGGNFRVVTYAQCPLELDIFSDQLLAEVTWSWLIDALAGHGAQYTRPAGTATRVISTGFGDLSDNPDSAHIELRASWSPTNSDLSGALEAFGDLLCLMAGLPPLPGAASLHAKKRERG